MIDPTLAAFFEGPVMMIFATRSAAGGPAIGRGMGGRVIADGREVEFYAGGRQWAEALDGLAVGDPVALTFCRLSHLPAQGPAPGHRARQPGRRGALRGL